jgi:hypothetical protein
MPMGSLMTRATVHAVALGLALIAADAARVWRDGRSETGLVHQVPGAERTVRAYLEGLAELANSGGDPRAAERLPASPDLVNESLAGILFAERRVGATESRELVRLVLEGSRWIPGGTAEVRTREYWMYRVTEGGQPAVTETRPVVGRVRYDLVLEGASWRVMDYQLAPDDGGAG